MNRPGQTERHAADDVSALRARLAKLETELSAAQLKIEALRIDTSTKTNDSHWIRKELKCTEALVEDDGTLSYLTTQLLAGQTEIIGPDHVGKPFADVFRPGAYKAYADEIRALFVELTALAKHPSPPKWNQRYPDPSSSTPPLAGWASYPESAWRLQRETGHVSSRLQKCQYYTSPAELIRPDEDYRIEYFAQANQVACDLSLVVGGKEQLSAKGHVFVRPDDHGYCFGFGAYANASTVLQREFRTLKRSKIRIHPRAQHHCVAERIGGCFRFLVDDRLAFEHVDPLPLLGPGTGYISFYTYERESEFWGLKVWTRPSIMNDETLRRIDAVRVPILRTAGKDSRHLEFHLVKVTQKGEGKLQFKFLLQDATDLARARARALKRKHAKRALKKAKQKLEARVQERTEHLKKANERLKKEAAERKRMGMQLGQAQKMDAIGRLAGGLAHDFNNLLTVILGRTERALEGKERSDPERADLLEVRKATERATSLVQQLLLFGRQQFSQPRFLNLNEVLDDFRGILRHLLGEAIELETILADKLGSVKVDASQFEQVLVNLATNARDVMPSGGKFLVETQNVEVDESFARTHLGVKPGPYVMLAFTDTGHGMDEQTRDRVFEPFFTTKDVGKGTGLGLSSVYGIVKQNGGHIWVYSEPGHGTTFKIYLPRQQQQPSKSKQKESSADLRRCTETILVVEDEAAVRKLISANLQSKGYRVLTAKDGVDALDVFESAQDPIDLLVTDVVMPRMSGEGLAENLLAKRPDMKVIFISGYAEGLSSAATAEKPGVAFIQKPFTQKALARKIGELLERPSTDHAKTA